MSIQAIIVPNVCPSYGDVGLDLLGSSKTDNFYLAVLNAETGRICRRDVVDVL